MEAVRRLFWILLILGGGLVLLLAGLYLKLSADLPEMQTDGQVVGLIGRSVEAYRGQKTAETGAKLVAFEVLPRETLEAPVGRALLAFLGCPDYLTGPVPSGLDFWKQQLSPGEGSAACTAKMATDLATRLLLPSAQHTAVAADRIRGLLGRDALFAVWASALPFDPDGPQGLDPASRALFHQTPVALDWERAAELVVASGAWEQAAVCKNPAHLREMRDQFLTRAAELTPSLAHELVAAAKQPLVCERPRK